MSRAIRAWRRWRLHVWETRLAAREVIYESFCKNPWDGWFTIESGIKNKLLRGLAAARYRIEIHSRMLGPEQLPEAKARKVLHD